MSEKFPVLLLIVESEEKSDRLVNALDEDGYEHQTIIGLEDSLLVKPAIMPDLVILWFPYSSPDAMPELERTILHLRTFYSEEQVPLLLIIDQYGKHWVEPAFDLGVSDILMRPIHPLILRQRVKLLLQARQTEQAVERHKKSEAELAFQEQLFRTIADFTYDWEYWIDPLGRMIYNSPACNRITGYSTDEFVNDPSMLLNIVHPTDRDLVKNHFLEERESAEPCSLDFRIQTRDGETRWIGHACQTIYGAEGSNLGRRVSNRDITERRLAEQALVRAERLSTMGRLLASLAHEINNPLQAIYSNIELALDFPIEELERKKYLEIVRREIQRLMKVNHSILGFSRPIQEEHQLTHLKNLLENALLLAGKSVRDSRLQVTLSIPEALPPLMLPADPLCQVCLNLIINATEHVPAGGHLHISATLLDGNLQLHFCDDGSGIPQDVMDMIFEPFFSTKANGSGLGLAISQRIIHENGGTLSVKNLPEKGTEFVITLPVD